MSYCPTCGNANGVHWQGCQTSAAAEHANPEQSPELLRVELQACKTRIGEMRREINGRGHAADLRAEIIYQLWPEVVMARRWQDREEADFIDHLVHDGVLSEEAADELRRVLGVS